MKLSRRKWVVENRPAMFPNDKWEISLGPYVLEKTAIDMKKQMRSYVPSSLVALRVRNLEEVE